MKRKIKYPLGIQTFSEIIEEGYLYVDKTEFVHKLASESKYNFLSRPRRFGKSLLMSTFEAYFRGRKELFDGLALSRLETEWKEYPVFRFDLSGENYVDFSRLIENIGFYLDKIELTYGLSSEGSIATRFKQLILQAYRKYDSKVVILIDEYDKPLLDCVDDSARHDMLKNELRSFYSCIKACDEYIRFAMLTGVTRFERVSIFSGLNNLKDISLNVAYNDICGISESEFHKYFEESIRNFASANDIAEEQAWEMFKEMYDGYHFASRGEYVYNPYSVLHAFEDNELKSYWYGTGSSSYLVSLIEKNSYTLDKIEGQRRTEEQLENITEVRYDLVPLLYQSGYLTIKGYDPESKEYTLGFPNREVSEAFWTSLKNHFFRSPGGGSFDFRHFLDELYSGKVNEFMLRLQALFADTSSEPEAKKEIHFQNMMAVVAKMLGLSVRTEVHSSAGRCDMQILTDRYIYIFEFKVDGTSKEAIKQINENGYCIPFLADDRQIKLIGANFSSKTRTLTDWIIEDLSWVI